MSDVITKRLLSISILFVVVLCVVVIYCGMSLSKKSIELNTLKNNIDTQKVLSDTKAKLDEILKRQNEIYPQLIEANKKLKDQADKLSKIQDDIKIVKKEKINEEVAKMDLSDLSNYLLSVGYPNSIVSK